MKLTIGAKISGLITLLLFSAVAALLGLSTQIYVDTDRALIQQTNSDSAYHLATQIRELFRGFTSELRILGNLLHSPPDEALKAKILDELFAENSPLLGACLLKVEAFFFVKVSEKLSSRAPQNLCEKTLQVMKDSHLNSITSGETTFFPLYDEGVIAVGFPFIRTVENGSEATTHFLLGWMPELTLQRVFSETNLATGYLIDSHGKILAHREKEQIGRDGSKIPIVRELLEGKLSNAERLYIDPSTQEPRLAAFRILGFAHLGVIAEVPADKAFEAAHKVEYRTSLVAWIILCLSLMLGFRYSNSLTKPIRMLSSAAQSIAQGNFQIQVSLKEKDEIGELSRAFILMAQGLQERDKVKSILNKFHSKEIADKLLSGEVKIGGERKEAVVFFSDIRGFTSLSESLSPEEIVEMLNEYLSSMVAIIRSFGGIVDKYIGDAIMGIWGIPVSTPEDTAQAIRACLAMREELLQLNHLRLSRNQPPLRMGMGLNKGILIAGNIGSEEKMEYTVIGDAVNLASRIESMTKEHGVDLLVSASVYEEVKELFVFEAAQATQVKGKTDPVQIYKVTGFISPTGEPILIETPYSTYPQEKSDKVIH